jgi:hypothetical protein
LPHEEGKFPNDDLTGEAPPPNRPPDEEQVKLIAELIVSDDRWVKNLIDGLAGILRDVKH